MVNLISLSKSVVKKVRTVEAIFNVDGDLVPYKVSEDDRPEAYSKINNLIANKDLDITAASDELFRLMAPSSTVKHYIDKSTHLSENLSIIDGKLFFGEFQLEKELSDHMLSLLNTENIPKDEDLWKSYIRFLDNLHQNVDEDIRKQLFRWINYENIAGNGFAITDDGCLVGYKGCNGTVLNPVSVHSGHAIVDGVEMNGIIPNEVGNVIKMPRSSVQYDPGVGCSTGLHVGTRDYAERWAPILLLVKVNPRDVVSVPYECESQKMRVCEYTVLEVTDATAEHQRYIKSEKTDFISTEFAEELLDEKVFIEYDGDKEFEGFVVEVYTSGTEDGLIIKNTDNEYKHIKLHRLTYIEVLNDDDDDDDYNYSEDDIELPEDIQNFGKVQLQDVINDDNIDEDGISAEVLSSLLGKKIKLTYSGKEFVGTVTDLYESVLKPGLIMVGENGERKHIKYYRINKFEVLDDNKNDKSNDNGTFANISPQQTIMAVYKSQSGMLKTVIGKVVKIDDDGCRIYILSNDSELITLHKNDIIAL